MKTQTEILREIHKLIPDELMERYGHLTFGEMAKQSELQPWKAELLQAERDCKLTEWGGMEGKDT